MCKAIFMDMKTGSTVGHRERLFLDGLLIG
jgi:hypothetical protein